MKTNPVIDQLKSSCIYRIEEGSRMLDRCLLEFDDTSIWERPNPATNSVANLLLHLEGNMRQYVLSSLGGNPDTRRREREFEVDGGYTKSELTAGFYQALDQVKTTIKTVGASELLREREVQGFTLSGIGILVHVVEHYSYHIGQIALWTKIRTDRDLGFYEGMDLNILNP